MPTPPRIDRDEVARRFRHYPPSESRAAQHVAIRSAVADAAGALADTLPEGREKSLAITALEEATFWANAALARSETFDADAFADVASDGVRDGNVKT